VGNRTDPLRPRCTLPCDNTLCEDQDGIWENGCEVAKAYQTPRNSTPVGDWDCSIWSKDLLLAKKHHMSVPELRLIGCEGRPGAAREGTCIFQVACLLTSSLPVSGLHNYQDCNSDPRDGCEDTGRWCLIGDSSSQDPRGTQSDLCSSALKYFCDASGFDALDRPCHDPQTGITLTYPADPHPAHDCYGLGGNSFEHVNVAAVTPYCDRDPTHLETRGDCVFVCQTNYSNCNNDAQDGCEKNIFDLKYCDYDCVDCVTLSGRDQSGGAPACVADPLNAGRARCLFNCTAGICEDVDKDWKNGCEVARNGDDDALGVFMNIGENMDCAVLSEEAERNPELFRHHLHIDLEKKIQATTDPNPLPPGSIFCNNGAISDPNFNGRCYFACVTGFENLDHQSYNGCEAPNDDNPAVLYPYSGLNPAEHFGGYWIGDPLAEGYLNFLCDIDLGAIVDDIGNPLRLTVPRDICRSALRRSGAFSVGLPLLWY